jgi:hypothetical protein
MVVPPTTPQKKHRFLRFLKTPMLFLGAFFCGGLLIYAWLTLKPTGIEKIRERRTEILAEADRLIQESFTTETLPVRNASTPRSGEVSPLPPLPKIEPAVLAERVKELDAFFTPEDMERIIQGRSLWISRRLSNLSWSFTWTIPQGEAVQARFQSQESGLRSGKASNDKKHLEWRVRGVYSGAGFSFDTPEKWIWLHAALDKTEALLETSWSPPQMGDFPNLQIIADSRSFEPLAYLAVVRAGLRGQNDRAEFLFLRMIETTAFLQRFRFVNEFGTRMHYVALAALWLAERETIPPENWGRIVQTLERTRIKPRQFVPLCQAYLTRMDHETRQRVKKADWRRVFLSSGLRTWRQENLNIMDMLFDGGKPVDWISKPVNALARPLFQSWENERLAGISEEVSEGRTLLWQPGVSGKDRSKIGIGRVFFNPSISDSWKRVDLFGQKAFLVREPRLNYVWYLESQDLVPVYYYVALAAYRAQQGRWPDRIEDVAGIFPFDEMTGVSPWKMTRIRIANDSFRGTKGEDGTTSASQSQSPTSGRFREQEKEVPVVYQVLARATLENGTIQYPEKEKEYLNRVKGASPMIDRMEISSYFLPEERKEMDATAREPGKPLDLELVEVFYPLYPGFADPDFWEGLRAGPPEEPARKIPSRGSRKVPKPSNEQETGGADNPASGI